jgi:hypothetical protein
VLAESLVGGDAQPRAGGVFLHGVGGGDEPAGEEVLADEGVVRAVCRMRSCAMVMACNAIRPPGASTLRSVPKYTGQYSASTASIIFDADHGVKPESTRTDQPSWARSWVRVPSQPVIGLVERYVTGLRQQVGGGESGYSAAHHGHSSVCHSRCPLSLSRVPIDVGTGDPRQDARRIGALRRQRQRLEDEPPLPGPADYP